MNHTDMLSLHRSLSGYGWPRGLYCNSGPTAEHCHRLLEDELGIQCSCEYGSLDGGKAEAMCKKMYTVYNVGGC